MKYLANNTTGMKTLVYANEKLANVFDKNDRVFTMESTRWEGCLSDDVMTRETWTHRTNRKEMIVPTSWCTLERYYQGRYTCQWSNSFRGVTSFCLWLWAVWKLSSYSRRVKHGGITEDLHPRTAIYKVIQMKFSSFSSLTFFYTTYRGVSFTNFIDGVIPFRAVRHRFTFFYFYILSMNTF